MNTSERVLLFIGVFLLIIFIAIAYAKLNNNLNIQEVKKVIDGGGRTKKADKIKDLEEFPASRFENTVRGIIERLTSKKFPCVWPSWLVHNGKQLELDGYNAEIKIAFETQGPQHTVWKNKYDPDYISYVSRVENDKAKISLCEKENVGLIVVDYLIPKYLLGRYIRSRIYDISEQWKAKGLFKQVELLGALAFKTGDYIEPIIKPAIIPAAI